jgi:1-acyl-sn-glycerol-3-phosphate acyltransferase
MAEAPSKPADSAGVEGRGSLLSVSFLGLTLTQLLTAVNDNIFRWLVIGIGKEYVEQQHVGSVLMAGTACFVLPYLVLAAPAGYLADRFSKRDVIVACKVAEIVIMILGVIGILMGSLWFLFVAVALMGAQSALFSPAKMGAIPEILKADKISAANGIFGLATVISTVIGMAVGNWLSDFTRPKGLGTWVSPEAHGNLWHSAGVLIGVAVVGTLFSLLIKRLPAGNPQRPFPWDAVSQTWRDVRTLWSHRALFRVALGMVFFWSVGALAQLNIDQFAFEGGATAEFDKTPLLIALVIGVGAGSILAGVMSGGRVELGIVPLGAFGVALFSMLLFTVGGTLFEPTSEMTAAFIWAGVLLCGLGVSAGFFDVPLEAYMQDRSPREARGSILAAANLLIFSGVLLAAVLYNGLRWPVYEGSLENIAELESLQLTEAEQARVAEAERDFKQAWAVEGRGEPPRIEDYPLAGADNDVRRAVLAHLLWIELEQLGQLKQPIDKQAYYDRFPADKLLVKSVFDQSAGLPLFDSRQIFFLFGFLTIPVLIYIVWKIPQNTVRFLVWLASLFVYRIRIFGRENVPERGGALLVSNHISWLDGFLFLLISSRPVRLIAFTGNFPSRWLHRLATYWGVIMIGTRPKEIRNALVAAKQALLNGELVCIFPEGGISRTGQVQAFRPGLLKIAEGTGAPIVPVFLDELWGSIFSFEGGKFFWKLPRRWPYPISIHFGKPLAEVDDVHQVRQAVQALGAEAFEQRIKRMTPPPVSFIRQCKRRKRKLKAADSTGAELSGGNLLLRTLVLRRLLRRHVLADDEQYVGVLVPPTVPALATNMALSLDRRVAVNLNYTVTSDVMNYCIKEAGIRHVLTSKKFMDKMNFKLDCEVVYLEDLRDKPTTTDKLVAALQAFVTPAGMLARSFGLHKIAPDDVLTVIFTSGSTGTPKGVMLTHANVASNVQAVDQVIHLKPQDVLIGILPYFHSLGYTITMWGAMGLDIAGIYHFSPLDGKQIGKLCEKHKGTLLLSAPTFLRTFLKRTSKEEFATLDTVVTGAEKLPPELADAFEEKFGVRPVEGYGTTELSPLVAVNIPPSRTANFQADCKEGTVGRPVPGVSAKVLDLDDGRELGADQPGMLWIRGPNVMKGYLNRPEATAEVIQDGWYKTGDVALIDEDGFIKITGRMSRFSKIGGEMVPHLKVEEELSKALSNSKGDAEGAEAAAGEDKVKLAVTSLPHPTKGERLVVVHVKLDKTPDELRKALTEAGLPNIFIPAADSFIEVEELPLLGSGKFDLKRIQEIARERLGEGGKDVA